MKHWLLSSICLLSSWKGDVLLLHRTEVLCHRTKQVVPVKSKNLIVIGGYKEYYPVMFQGWIIMGVWNGEIIPLPKLTSLRSQPTIHESSGFRHGQRSTCIPCIQEGPLQTLKLALQPLSLVSSFSLLCFFSLPELNSSLSQSTPAISWLGVSPFPSIEPQLV